MLYDLNIAWSPFTSTNRLIQTLSFASSLGYATVALNHTLELPFPANPTAPFPSLPAASSSSASSPKLPNVLRRATLPLADPAATNYRLSSLTAAYDLIAVRPLTSEAFDNACHTLDVPIISLDLTQHFPFHFRKKTCNTALQRGVRFEICYSQNLTADPRGRVHFMENVKKLITATAGQGIIISSEAKGPLGLRAPADIVNLLHCSCPGLKVERGIEGFRSEPRSVVVNEGIKRNGFRGVVNIVQVATKDATSAGDSADGRGSAQDSDGKQNKNQKRKNGEADAQPMSKRQAKKLKLATRAASNEKKPSS